MSISYSIICKNLKETKNCIIMAQSTKTEFSKERAGFPNGINWDLRFMFWNFIKNY